METEKSAYSARGQPLELDALQAVRQFQILRGFHDILNQVVESGSMINGREGVVLLMEPNIFGGRQQHVIHLGDVTESGTQ